MNETLQLLFENFGKTLTLIFLVFVGAGTLLSWVFAHRSSPAYKEVTWLWGLVRYTKGSSPPRGKKKSRQIRIVHSDSETLWRIAQPLDDWIEQDLANYSRGTIDSILLGPNHEVCKSDLSYRDKAAYASGSYVKRVCQICDTVIVPDGISNDRHDFKKFVLKRIQEANLRGDKIKNGMRI